MTKVTINFLPDSNREDFSEAIKEYKEIWNTNGDRIIESWEKHTNLGFRETEINAIVGDFRSHSHPLTLRHNLDYEKKKSVLVHEIGHRILAGRINGLKARIDSDRIHKFMYLVLIDIYVDLYDQEFLNKVIEHESDGQFPLYGEAWKFVQSFQKEERHLYFRNILEGDLSVLSK